MNEPVKKARYIMIGGFLGAGKTTAMARLAGHLTGLGNRVGLICNDQTGGLVDTALLEARGFPVEEIAGGCICSRFNSLLEAADRLSQEAPPDFFLAEPVGSFTNLLATVSYPLRRIHGDRFSVAPLSVLVDPLRAARMLGIEAGRRFSDKVAYVFHKQLEEADAIVVNKCDTCPAPLREKLVTGLRKSCPRAEIFCFSAREGTDCDPWFQYVLTARGRTDGVVDIDPDRHAEGEAMLGWLNCTVRLAAEVPFDANQTLLGLARDIRDRLLAEDRNIAHLKMTMDGGDGNLSAVSLVHEDGEPDLRESLLDTMDRAVLVINLRAEGDPDLLGEAIGEALSCLRPGIRPTLVHEEKLRPGRPAPTHRMESSGGCQ